MIAPIPAHCFSITLSNDTAHIIVVMLQSKSHDSFFLNSALVEDGYRSRNI